MYVSVEKQCMDTLLVNAKRNAFLEKKKTFLHCNSREAPCVRFLLEYILFL